MPAIFSNAMIAFAITLVLMHILVFFKWGRKPFWTSTDYIWLLVGFIGFVSASAEIQRKIASNLLDDEMKGFDGFKKFQTEGVEFNVRFYSNYNFSQWPEEKKNVAVPEYDRVATWYRDLRDALKDPEESKWLKFLETRGNSEMSHDDGLRQSQESTVGLLKYLKGRYDRYMEVKSATEESRALQIAGFLSPFFIGISLAIRISKVSAQLRGIA